MDSAEQIAAEYLSRHGTVDIGRAISRGIDLVRDNVGPLVGGTLLVFLVSFGLAIVPVIGWFADALVSSVMGGGLFYMFLRRIRGEPVTAGDVFAGFSIAFANLLLCGVVSQILVGLGVILCVLPGIYLAVGYAFALPLVIDRKLEFWTAMEVSRRVVHPQWFSIFGLVIVAGLIGALGLLACGIGVFVTIPVATAGIAYAYEDLFPPGGAATQPSSS